MLMNNGQNTRSYSPVDMHAQKAGMAREDHKEHLRELIGKQMELELVTALTMAELGDAYCKMGLPGHKHKLYYKSSKEYKETYEWREYYMNMYGEAPKLKMEYESKPTPKSIDELNNRLYDLHMKNKENLHEILKVVSEHHLYGGMDMLLKMYKKCEAYGEMLETKMRSAQMFGYDVAYIMCKDDELVRDYEKCKAKKKKEKREREEHHDHK